MWEGTLWHVSGFMGYFLTDMFGFATFCDVFWRVSRFSAVHAATYQLFTRRFSRPVGFPMVGALLPVFGLSLGCVSGFLIVLRVVILPVVFFCCLEETSSAFETLG